MTVAVAPPLRAGVGARGDRQHVAGRRGHGEVFGGVAVRRHRHRRAALGVHAVDIEHARELVAVRREVQPLRIRRPAGHELGRVVEGQAREITGRQPEQVDVAAAGARRGEGEALAVGRIQRPRLGRRVRHEQAGVAAARGHFPDVAAAHEGDGHAVGRHAGFAQRWQRRGSRGCGQGKRDPQNGVLHAAEYTAGLAAGSGPTGRSSARLRMRRHATRDR